MNGWRRNTYLFSVAAMYIFCEYLDLYTTGVKAFHK